MKEEQIKDDKKKLAFSEPQKKYNKKNAQKGTEHQLTKNTAHL